MAATAKWCGPDYKPLDTASFPRCARRSRQLVSDAVVNVLAPVWGVARSHSRLFFAWATPLFRLGFQRPLVLGDLWGLRLVPPLRPPRLRTALPC